MIALPPLGQQVGPALDQQTQQKAADLAQPQLGNPSNGTKLEAVTPPPPQPADDLAGAAAPQPAAPPAPSAATFAPVKKSPGSGRKAAAGATARPGAPDAADAAPGMPLTQITRSTGAGSAGLSIHIQNEDIRDVLDALADEGSLNILCSKSVKGKVGVTLRNVDVDTALTAIIKSMGFASRREGKFIYVGLPDEFHTMEQSADKMGTRVYRPNYIVAAELEALIKPMLTEKLGVLSVSAAAEAGMAATGDSAGGNKFAGSETVLVRDYEAVLNQIDQLVAEVDIRPMQVAIEAMILSVGLQDSNSFGVNFQLLKNQSNVVMGLGMPPAALSDITFTQGGLQFGFLDSTLGAFLNALETVGDVHVVASPRITVINKQKADVHIGQELGYITSTITETSTSQTVAFLEIGTQLRLRPFISTDGLIRMEVHPELSTGNVQVQSGFTIPNKDVTQVTTNVMVRDGCTVVIGGLMREDLGTTATEIPLLGALPVVGPLFRQSSETTNRSEVIILLTPHITYDQESGREGEAAACDFHRGHAVYAEKMNWMGRRSIARRYFRMAQNAWAAGDRPTALRFAEMAVHFDPLNRAAIDLRSNIWQGRPYGQYTLAKAPAGAHPLDGPQVADWLLDDLEQEPMVQLPPIQPLDRGQTGAHQDLLRPGAIQ